jgi:NAD(P)-dependent dehydrogenase (short-subunit alcohol dehydrogenase family)
MTALSIPHQGGRIMRLQGRRILVTGAARGIGRAVSLAVVGEGAAVAVVDIDGAGASAVAAEIGSSGGTAIALTCDITDSGACALTVQRAAETLGGLDGLVNNAGILIEEELGLITESHWDRTLAVNLTAPWRLTQLVLPWFDEATGGSIVNISSIEGMRVRPTHAAYSASKGGLLQLTRTTAVELGHRNVRANAVCPGSIDTEMFRGHVNALDDPESALTDLIGRNFTGRLGRVDEVASVVVHLLSDEAAFTTGHTYVIDGARTVAT